MLTRLSRQCFCTVAPAKQPWLFVGLGNPGDKYQGTRHNVGFQMIDVFAKSQGISMDAFHCKALFGQGFVGEVPIFLAKPQTYMNLSGESTDNIFSSNHYKKRSLSYTENCLLGSYLDSLLAGPLAAYFKLPLNRVLVFHDDINLPCGVLRLNAKLKGHGSHNGLKNVIRHFRGNREFPRLRIGIGRPPGQMDPKAFLLQKFNATAQERIDIALQEGVSALRLLCSEGFSECERCFNTEQKYKHIRLQTLPV